MPRPGTTEITVYSKTSHLQQGVCMNVSGAMLCSVAHGELQRARAYMQYGTKFQSLAQASRLSYVSWSGAVAMEGVDGEDFCATFCWGSARFRNLYAGEGMGRLCPCSPSSTYLSFPFEALARFSF